MAVAVVEENPIVEYLDDVKLFVDDVKEFQCVRCHKVLFQHYISNCGHSFCANCKRVLDDGSQQWKCPRCEEYIEHIDARNEDLEKALKAKRVHCPNYKYGCPFVDQLQLIKNHLKQCDFTKDKCLPIPLEDNENKNMNVEQMFKINERFHELTTEMQEMRGKIVQLESKDKEDETTLEKKLEFIKSIVNGARSDMKAETNKIYIELDKMKSMDLVLEECKSKLTEFKGKSDSIYGLVDFKEEKLMKAIVNATTEARDEFRANLMEIRKELNGDLNTRCGILMSESKNAAREIEVFRVDLAQQTQKIDELTLTNENEKLDMEKANDDFKNEIIGIKSSLKELDKEINLLQFQINENDILNAQTLNTPNENFVERLNEVTIALNENIESTEASFEKIKADICNIQHELEKHKEQIISVDSITKCVNENQIRAEAVMTRLQDRQIELETDLETEISNLTFENTKTEEEYNNKLEYLRRQIEKNQEKINGEMEQVQSLHIVAKSAEESLIRAQTFITDLQIQQNQLETDLNNNNNILKDLHKKLEVLTNDLDSKETKDESFNKQRHIIQLIENLSKEMEQTKSVEANTAHIFKALQSQADNLIRDLQTKQEELEADFYVKIEFLRNQLEDKENKNESAGKMEYLHQLIEENKDKFTSETKSIESITKTFEEKTTALQTKQQKLEAYLKTVWKRINETVNNFDSKHQNLSIQLDSKETKEECETQFERLVQQIEENKKELHQMYQHEMNHKVQENQDVWLSSSEIGTQNNSKAKSAFKVKTELAGPSQVEISSSTIASKTITSTISRSDLEIQWPSKEKITYNVLLLGQIGVGKSTFVNAFCNYFELEDAKLSKTHNLNVIKNCDFTSTDQKAERLYVQLNDDAKECFQTGGQSSTKVCTAYEFQIQDFNFRLIDTPGIGDGRGIEEDTLHLEETMQFISQNEELHAICIFIKPDETLLNPTIKYCIKQFLSQLHQNSRNNLVFVFTNSQSPSPLTYYVQPFLKKIKSVPEIPFHKDNIFCFENEVFKYLIDEQIPIQFEDERFQDFKHNWKKSANEIQRLLTYIVENRQEVRIEESISMDLIRRAIIEISHSLSKISEIISEKKKETPISTFVKEMLKNDLEDYENLQYKLTDYMNNLAIYLNGNALVVVNNECEEHLKALITKENSLNKNGSDNQMLIKRLIDMVENQRGERSILDKVIKDNKQNQQRVELENVRQIFLELAAMELSEKLNHISEKFSALHF